ncbi:hypothetical protein GCK72_019721 [Caenorhabditis remanei]|uniref:Uncharacterized protein n=1 Tax=Caenorhabditis remanei TaxID=31234 RepID=A0A6A5GEP9_CAERE|nr:hypothetical protein GCK72_019721 [Caenorhabditis remanei]KAF1753165.1 hypothetical protein GCK72_019721 [Caenorhabditis remanei]
MQSLIYNLCRANYTFHLLSHGFDVHEGIKLVDTPYSQAVTAHQQTYARDLAQERYTQEMDYLYPDTLKKCQPFSI